MMRKATEFILRVQAAACYPECRLDFIDPTTAVLTNIMGRQRIIIFKRRRRRGNRLFMRSVRGVRHWIHRSARWVIDAVVWIVPAVICLLGMWLAFMLIVGWSLGAV